MAAALDLRRPTADTSGVTTIASSTTTTFLAARSRAHGPTSALWHAVEVHRTVSEVDGATELTVCGVLARIVTDQTWPAPTRDVCSSCIVVAG